MCRSVRFFFCERISAEGLTAALWLLSAGIRHKDPHPNSVTCRGFFVC
jgi:hypothetical protein